jgi:hypothetical protein
MNDGPLFPVPPARTPHLDTARRDALVQAVPPGESQMPTASPPPSILGLRDLGDDVPWWTPSWQDRARAVGWKWVFALPAAIVIGLMVASLWYGHLFLGLWFGGIKIVMLCLAVPVALLLEVVRGVMAGRTDPFCIHCGYSLDGLPDHHICPECGRPYSFALIDEYRRDPHWFIRRHKMRHQMPDRDAPFLAGPVRSKKSKDGT